MKKLYLLLMLFLITSISFLSQNVTKDTLYFKIDFKYIDVKKNYEGVHAFVIKNENIVTSAFGKIGKEDLFFFSIGIPSN